MYTIASILLYQLISTPRVIVLNHSVQQSVVSLRVAPHKSTHTTLVNQYTVHIRENAIMDANTCLLFGGVDNKIA